MSETPIGTPDIIMKLKGYEGSWIATDKYVHFSLRDWTNKSVQKFIEDEDLTDLVDFRPSEAPWAGPKVTIKGE